LIFVLREKEPFASWQSFRLSFGARVRRGGPQTLIEVHELTEKE